MFASIKTLLIWSLLSFVICAPMLVKRGLDVVTRTYHGASVQISEGQNPYAKAQVGGDFFKYSPLFGVGYRIFAALPETFEVLGWALVNIVVFWMALVLWSGDLSFRNRGNWPLLGLWLIASMELDISLRYQQFNACLAGLVLLAFYLLRERRHLGAGLVLALATNLKILPVLFALALLRPFRSAYLKGLVLGALIALVLPALFLGFRPNMDLHLSWFQLLLSDLNAPGLLDIKSLCIKWGWPRTGGALKLIIGAATLFCVLYPRRPSLAWLFSFGMAALLLLSPRTESPTFVLMAPAYVLMALEFRTQTASRLWSLSLLIIAIATTLVYTDLWPRFLWSPSGTGYASKGLGALGLWSLMLAWWWRHGLRARAPQAR